jgi:Core-2/I-Branching enzyme
MKIAYIISAYKYPHQLVRLVRALHTDNTAFFVHVDKKSGTDVYEKSVRGVRDLPRVVFLERHTCHWGGFGHVRATLKGIDEIFQHSMEIDYVFLLTGQDYPIKSNKAIEEFLLASDGQSYLGYSSLPSPRWSPRGGLDRIERWHLRAYGFHVALPRPRRFPEGLRPFGGGAYWCLSGAAVRHVHEFVKKRPDYVKFFRHVDIPDELFFHTIILNSAHRERVVNDNLRYIDWTKGPSPAILTTADFDELVRSSKLFARKFDTTVDAEVLDMIDERILEQT